MRNNINNKVSSKFLNIFIPALVISLFLGVIIAYYIMVRVETKERMIKSCEISSVSSSSQIDKILTSGSEALKLASYTIDNMITSGNTQEEIHDYMVNETVALAYANSAMTSGIYGYIRGEYLDGTNWVPEADYVSTERPWYIGAMANSGEITIVDPYLDAMTGTIIVTFCKTLCDGESVLSMDYSMELLQEVTEDIIKDSDADIEIVLDQNFRVIAHSDKNEVGKDYSQEDETFGSALISELRQNNDGYFSIEFDGSDYIVYIVSIFNDWICLSIFDATSVFSQMVTVLIFSICIAVIGVGILLIIMITSSKNEKNIERINNVIEALAASIDAKDPYTNGHSSRVAEYSKEISKRFGYSKKKQEEIYLMGLLHDIGKIGIPDSVINKPGKLTSEEYCKIKEHPEIGWGILSKVNGMQDIMEGARWHHERYDGAGYPDGLKGKDIPESARIIAVADAYDAMTSRRSYRDILSQEEVYNEIINCKGTQFDPVFADIMLQMIDEDKDYQMRGKN